MRRKVVIGVQNRWTKAKAIGFEPRGEASLAKVGSTCSRPTRTFSGNKSALGGEKENEA